MPNLMNHPALDLPVNAMEHRAERSLHSLDANGRALCRNGWKLTPWRSITLRDVLTTQFDTDVHLNTYVFPQDRARCPWGSVRRGFQLRLSKAALQELDESALPTVQLLFVDMDFAPTTRCGEEVEGRDEPDLPYPALLQDAGFDFGAQEFHDSITEGVARSEVQHYIRYQTRGGERLILPLKTALNWHTAQIVLRNVLAHLQECGVPVDMRCAGLNHLFRAPLVARPSRSDPDVIEDQRFPIELRHLGFNDPTPFLPGGTLDHTQNTSRARQKRAEITSCTTQNAPARTPESTRPEQTRPKRKKGKDVQRPHRKVTKRDVPRETYFRLVNSRRFTRLIDVRSPSRWITGTLKRMRDALLARTAREDHRHNAIFEAATTVAYNCKLFDLNPEPFRSHLEDIVTELYATVGDVHEGQREIAHTIRPQFAANSLPSINGAHDRPWLLALKGQGPPPNPPITLTPGPPASSSSPNATPEHTPSHAHTHTSAHADTPRIMRGGGVAVLHSAPEGAGVDEVGDDVVGDGAADVVGALPALAEDVGVVVSTLAAAGGVEPLTSRWGAGRHVQPEPGGVQTNVPAQGIGVHSTAWIWRFRSESESRDRLRWRLAPGGPRPGSASGGRPGPRPRVEELVVWAWPKTTRGDSVGSRRQEGRPVWPPPQSGGQTRRGLRLWVVFWAWVVWCCTLMRRLDIQRWGTDTRSVGLRDEGWQLSPVPVRGQTRHGPWGG